MNTPKDIYSNIISSLSKDFKEIGFIKKGVVFHKETKLMRFKVPFHKSRESRSDCIIFSFHVEAFIINLDKYYRSDNPIPTAMDYDFVIFANTIAGEDEKYWSIFNDSQAEPILSEIRQLIIGIKEYCTSDEFSSLKTIQNKLEKETINSIKCPIKECMRLLAFLASIQDYDTLDEYYLTIKEKFKLDPISLRIAENDLTKIKDISKL
jgi:hypothetical protein